MGLDEFDNENDLMIVPVEIFPDLVVAEFSDESKGNNSGV